MLPPTWVVEKSRGDGEVYFFLPGGRGVPGGAIPACSGGFAF